MAEASGWRRALARWLDPSIEVVSEPIRPEARRHEPTPNPWPAISEQFALRILSAAYQISGQLEAAEADERDPDRLEKLYRIDHAATRVRRQAENLQVLGGHKVEDAGRQITSMLDVVRASTSAIEYYSRVQLGRIIDLAVVEFAADDVIRVVTELLDNAARFSPPTSPVTVSAHLTERGSIFIRIEDAGVGIRADQLAAINAMLAGGAPPLLRSDSGLQLGLAVVQQLALAQQMRIHLGYRQPTGTIASVLIPENLVCEIPGGAAGISGAPRGISGSPAPSPHVARPAPLPPPPPPPPPYQPRSDTGYLNAGRHHDRMAVTQPLPVNGARTAPPDIYRPRPPAEAAESRATSSGLPIRVPESIRDQQKQPEASAFPPPPSDRDRWADETADFVAGIGDAMSALDAPNPEG